MSHMQLTCNIWRWNHDCIWFLLGIHFSVKVFSIHPKLINSLFYFMRLVSLCKFFAHARSSHIYQQQNLQMFNLFIMPFLPVFVNSVRRLSVCIHHRKQKRQLPQRYKDFLTQIQVVLFAVYNHFHSAASIVFHE